MCGLKESDWHFDGTFYEGEWLNHMSHGKGTITFEDGGGYDCDWKYDSYHGQGTLTYKSGSEHKLLDCISVTN